MESRQVVTLLAVLALAASALVGLIAVPSPARAAPSAPVPLLSDDFTRDTSLNASTWQVNGPVGSVFGPDEVGFSLVTLEPAFSLAGMEISQVNGRQEVGTIQSVESFTPPFTATATVRGTVSNGHTFGFAIVSANASSGVVIWGNLNDTNCSNLGDCGDPAVCGNTANPDVIPANQCYYGIQAKHAQGGGSWGNKTNLFLTPSLNVTYALQISVDASGTATYGVSQGGQALGNRGSAQVGTGPFYVIMDQGEGSPVGSGRDNQAYWMSVMVTSSALPVTTSTSPGPGTASSGIPLIYWLVIILAIALLFIFLLWYWRRRGFTVTVQESKTRSAIPGSSVLADGPESLSGVTEKDGRAKFGEVKEGDYTVRASASGYLPSLPTRVKVEKKTEYTVLLERAVSAPQGGTGGGAPLEGVGPTPQAQQLQGGVAPSAESPPPAAIPPGPAPMRVESGEPEGWGGPRIRQIIRTFQEKGAVSPETAMTAKELGLSRLFVRMMERRKGRTRIFVEIDGKYYLDQKALKESG